MKCDFCKREFMGLMFTGIDKRTGERVETRICLKCACERAAKMKEGEQHGTIDRQENRRRSET